MSSWTSVAVWMNSMTEAKRMDELDDRGEEDGEVALEAAEAGRHEQHRRADALSAAVLDVAADFRDDRDVRFDVACELALDLLEVEANGLEDVREGYWRFFHR
jgi:hypothetical protein